MSKYKLPETLNRKMVNDFPCNRLKISSYRRLLKFREIR